MINDKVILHIDVNSAFLSWEAAYRLQHGDIRDLREIPSVIGGDPLTRHGIVLAKSIPAKEYRILTGESLFSAKLKCPELVIVPPRYNLFIESSHAFVKILEDYSPSIQRYSIDECFMDYAGMEKHFGSPLQAAFQIKGRIRCQLGFTVNIGISNNKLLAKMASELKKPDMVHSIFPEEIKQKLWPLPVEDLFMIGRATTPKLHKKGIFTIGDLANTDPQLLYTWFKSYGVLIWNYANGHENSPVRNDGYPMKGLGNSTTISFDVDRRKTAYMILLSLAETVCIRLRDTKKRAGVISVSLKNKDFHSYSHQQKLYTPTDSTSVIFKKCCDLFDQVWKNEPLRHIGIRVSDLRNNDFSQLSFFETNTEKYRALDRTIDNIRLKYGPGSIIRSCFLNSELKPLTGGVIEEEYPMMLSIL